MMDQIVASGEGHFEHVGQSIYLAHQAGMLYGVFNGEEQLPAFISIGDHVSGREAIMLWVHPSHRRKGIGRFMVESLQITFAEDLLAGSEEFWSAVLPIS